MTVGSELFGRLQAGEVVVRRRPSQSRLFLMWRLTTRKACNNMRRAAITSYTTKCPFPAQQTRKGTTYSDRDESESSLGVIRIKSVCVLHLDNRRRWTEKWFKDGVSRVAKGNLKMIVSLALVCQPEGNLQARRVRVHVENHTRPPVRVSCRMRASAGKG